MRRRRTIIVAIILLLFATYISMHLPEPKPTLIDQTPTNSQANHATAPADRQLATDALKRLEVKGRAPNTNYKRTQFSEGWATVNGCDMRNQILQRDLTNIVLSGNCKVMSGTLNDPYTGKIIQFMRGADTSSEVQIDHVVALSNAWQTGAQNLDRATRLQLANDPLELLAVDGPANQQKSDGDSATWLPSNKPFRCQYVARQIAVKLKYKLWVTPAESQAMSRVLSSCPDQLTPL